MIVMLDKLRRCVKKYPALWKTACLCKEVLPVEIKDNLGRKARSPYSEVEIKNKVVFIHVPKTAGNGIFESLFNVEAQGHNAAINYKNYNKDLFKKSFKFGFTRHPLDRFVSSFYYLKQGGIGHYDVEFSKKYLEKFDSVDGFALELGKNEKLLRKVMKWVHFKPQHEFLCDSDGRIIVDFVGRFENIQCDYRQLCHLLGVPENELVHKNKSKHESYMSCYSESAKKVVFDIYEKDCQIFGYS